MKLKYIVFLPLAVFLFAGCIEGAGDFGAKQTRARIEAVQTLTDFQVPVKDGMATIVKLGQDTLAVTSTSAIVSVPRAAVLANELEITYSADQMYQNYASAEYWHYLCFEDSRMADYDYNDLVIHCRIKAENAGYNEGKFNVKHTVSVQPVALGAARKLRLGILYKENSAATQLQEKILCQDVRAELFNGDPSFPINTDPTKSIKQVSDILTPMLSVTNKDLDFKVVWFIETENGDRLYAATTNFDMDRSAQMMSTDGFPYGLSLTKKWDYPIEKCSVREAYPGFDSWIVNGNEATMLQNPVKSKIFPAAINKLWDYTL